MGSWVQASAVFTAFRNALSSVWGSPPLGNAAGFHGVSKRNERGGGEVGSNTVLCRSMGRREWSFTARFSFSR